MEKKGTKNLSEWMVFLGAIISTGDKTTQNGLGFEDVGDYVSAMMKAPAAFEGMAETKMEIDDLDANEMKQLAQVLSDNITLVNKDIELLTKKSIAAFLAVYEVIKEAKALKEA